MAVAVLLALGSTGAASAQPRWRPPPLQLPAAGVAREAGPERWIVGTRGGARAAALARGHGARALLGERVWDVPLGSARALAAALRTGGGLRFAEPDLPLGARQLPASEADASAWRPRLRLPFPWPAVSAQSPLLGILDSPADPAHPDLDPASFSVDRPGAAPGDHGTAVASVAVGAANGRGLLGTWPGARAVSLAALDPDGSGTCTQAVRALRRAVQLKVSVLNLSFGASGPCYALQEAIAFAVSADVLTVASAGNERQTFDDLQRTRNPVVFPAAFPHVVSVGAFGPSGRVAPFSTANGAVDVVAPGEEIIAAVTRGRYAVVSGTSFSAPMTAAAALWLRQLRPELDQDQVAGALRDSARDVGRKGWDPSSGYGSVDLTAALSVRVRARDPGEVNDDVEWVDGSRFTRADAVLNKGGRSASVRAVVDAWKDPADVYRIDVPARARLRFVLDPEGRSDPDLAVFGSSARTVFSRRARVGASGRGAGRDDAVEIRSTSRRTRRAYVAVYGPPGNGGLLDATYRLSVRRR